jgi:hypothetical protein
LRHRSMSTSTEAKGCFTPICPGSIYFSLFLQELGGLWLYCWAQTSPDSRPYGPEVLMRTVA